MYLYSPTIFILGGLSCYAYTHKLQFVIPTTKAITTIMSEIASLLKSAPPGEIDVLRHDILEITQNNNAVIQALDKHTEELNLATPTVVNVGNTKTVICKFNQLSDNTFYTHGSNPQKFEVDHISRKTTIVGDYDGAVEDTKELQTALDQYLSKHYLEESVGCVFIHDNEKKIVVVGRKLSPQNFFNGQMTGVYTVDSNLTGEITADVHYFEEGNVRMQTKHKVDVSAGGDPVKAIAKAESDFELYLNQTLLKLNEKEFKQIRRQLPITRQPMDWDKAVSGFNISKDL